MIPERRSITHGINVPTSLNRLKEPKIRGQPWFLVVAWAMFFLASTSTSLVLIKLHLPAIPSLLVPGAFFFILTMITARDRKQVLRSYNRTCLFLRLLRKDSTFKKYNLSLDDIKKWIPIESIEETGLVRFKNNTSTVAIMLDPPRNTSTELDQYNTRIMNIINTLHGDYTYQFCAISATEVKNYLADSAIEVLNKDIHRSLITHMYSVFEYAIKAKDTYEVPDWSYVLFVGMPITKSIKDAERMKDTFVSGLTKELERAKILSNVVTGRSNCIQLIRLLLAGD